MIIACGVTRSKQPATTPAGSASRQRMDGMSVVITDAEQDFFYKVAVFAVKKDGLEAIEKMKKSTDIIQMYCHQYIEACEKIINELYNHPTAKKKLVKQMGEEVYKKLHG
jgi:hypothetical protein